MLTNRSIPDAVLIPVLAYDDVHVAAQWLCNAFGFSERLRIGNHRIQLMLGSCALVVTQRVSPTTRSSNGTHSLLMRVPNANDHYARANAAGVETRGAPKDAPYGERQYSAVDVGGHSWTFSESIADVDPATWGGELVAVNASHSLHRYTPYLRCDNAAAAIEFYQAVFDAHEIVRLVEPGGRVAHAELTLGAVPHAVLMLSDEYPERGMVGPRALKGNSIALHLYVDDVDTVCSRAANAGAHIVRQPEADAFGDRGARFIDVCGHEWMVATRITTISTAEMHARFNAFFVPRD